MDEIIRSADKKTERVYRALKNGESYDELENDINFVWEAAFHKEKRIWEYVISNLYTLALVSKDVRNQMINKMKNGKANEKFKIVSSANSGVSAGPDHLPVDSAFLKQIVEMAILDKNKKVKLFGVERAGSLKFFGFADLIKTEAEKCSDEKLKGIMCECYTYYTKGYIVEECENGKRRIHFRTGFRSLESDIYDEAELHSYILEKYKDREDLRIIYNLK